MDQNYFLLFIIVAISIALLTMTLIKPQLGLAFTIASLPLYYLTALPKNFNFTSLTGILGGLTLVSYIWHSQKDRHVRETQEPRYTSDKQLYTVIFLLVIEIFIWDLLVPFHLDRLFFISYVQLLFLVWLVEQIIKTQTQLETLMKIFIIVNVVALLSSLKDFDFFAENSSVNRLTGLAVNANEFSIYIGVCVLFIMYFFEKASDRTSKIFLLGLGLSMFIPVLLSGSRGGFLFLVVALAYQFWRFQRNSLIIIGALFLLALLNSSFISRSYIERMLDIPTDLVTQSDTVGLRFNLWLYAIELWKTSPLWGIGTGMYMIRSIDSPLLHGVKMLQAHNAYITHLVENGVIGLFLFLVIILKSVSNYEAAIRLFHTYDLGLKKLAITWQSVLLLYALNSLKGNLNTGKIFWLTFGVSLVFNHLIFNAKQPVSQEKDAYVKPRLRTNFAKLR